MHVCASFQNKMSGNAKFPAPGRAVGVRSGVTRLCTRLFIIRIRSKRHTQTTVCNSINTNVDYLTNSHIP